MQQKPTKVVGRRVVAFLLDALIISIFVSVTWLLLTDHFPKSNAAGGGFDIGDQRYGFTQAHASSRGIWIILIVVFVLLVEVVLPALRGYTPGKAILGIRVIKADGSWPGFRRTIVRQLLWVIDGLFADLVAFVTAMSTKNNQRVGDLVAGTYVVRREAAGVPLALAAVPGAALGAVAPVPAGASPAGWFPDPQGEKRLRYWDGAAWTNQTAD